MKKFCTASADELQAMIDASLRKGRKAAAGEAEMNHAFASEQQEQLDRIMRESTEGAGTLSVENFYAYMPMHNYIHAPTRETWPASSVNARIPPIGKMSASQWIDKNQPVEQMSWLPGKPMLIRDYVISDGGWIPHHGNTVFNLYRPPSIKPGNPDQAEPWINHVAKIYPDDAEHIIRYLAHRVQKPEEKINHALVLGGAPQTGKDTLLEAVKRAVGPWNFLEVSPGHMLGRFNGFVKSVVLRINEARDLGEINRYTFYDHMKVYTAAPPDVLRCDEKNLREYSVPNVCGVIITTNYKTDGIYLPEDDRRHYVAWCSLSKDDFLANYWNEIYGFYEHGGYENVAAYLAQFDLSKFDPKAPPTKTPTFWAIVDASRAPEDAELADVLDHLGSGGSPPEPAPVVTLQMLIARATCGDFLSWLQDRKNRRSIPHRLERAGYIPVRNPYRPADGLWKIDGKRQVVYGHRKLSLASQIAATRKLGGK
jgi:hypothetical protein